MRRSWRKKDFEDGTYGMERLAEDGETWKVIKQNLEPLKFTKKEERDRIMSEIWKQQKI